MSALILYYSYLGNTRKIARAIARGMQLSKKNLLRIEDIANDSLNGCSLLVVGSPTIGFHPSPFIVRWMAALPANALAGISVAAFDTRTRMSDLLPFVQKLFLTGYGFAAVNIADELAAKGAKFITSPQGFFEQGRKGRLEDGEEDRAEAWRETLIKR